MKLIEILAGGDLGIKDDHDDGNGDDDDNSDDDNGDGDDNDTD